MVKALHFCSKTGVRNPQATNWYWPVACRLLCPWNFPGKNTGVGCHFLLQGIFQIWGSNLHLLHWLANFFYHCINWEAPRATAQSSSVTQSCLILCNPMNCNTPGFPVHHQLPDLPQTHVNRVGDAIQPSHPLSTHSPAFNLSQHQGLFQWGNSSHQLVKVLEFQLQHQYFQWIFRIDWFHQLVGIYSYRDLQLVENAYYQQPNWT